MQGEKENGIKIAKKESDDNKQEVDVNMKLEEKKVM